MAPSSQIRAWWSAYRCNPTKYATVGFPGVGRVWNLQVAAPSKPVWEAAAQIMRSEPYLFREVAGGTYNCRPPSLHAYALALDLNPSKNPFQNPPVHDYPASFIERMEGIRANGKQALTWGGRFPADNPPDTMHWQINVAPADCKNVTWDQGDDDMAVPMWTKDLDEAGWRNLAREGIAAGGEAAVVDYWVVKGAQRTDAEHQTASTNMFPQVVARAARVPLAASGGVSESRATEIAKSVVRATKLTP